VHRASPLDPSGFPSRRHELSRDPPGPYTRPDQCDYDTVPMKDRRVDSHLLIAEDPPPEAINEVTKADPADFAKQATDLQTLRDAVVDAASVGGGLWLSYLFVMFYLAIAAGGVTHRDLLFENPVKLPFLNIDLPLIGFFALGPPLFVIVHTYTLLHFTLLAGKVRDFDAALRQQIDDLDIQARLRRLLPINIFVQFLAGPREARTGGIGLLLLLITWISLAARQGGRLPRSEFCARAIGVYRRNFSR
jgi:hypothetical protein